MTISILVIPDDKLSQSCRPCLDETRVKTHSLPILCLTQRPDVSLTTKNGLDMWLHNKTLHSATHTLVSETYLIHSYIGTLFGPCLHAVHGV